MLRRSRRLGLPGAGEPLSIPRMAERVDWAASSLSIPAVLIWTVHVIITSFCLLHAINETISLVLAVGWLTSALLCVCVSKGRRGRALLAICFSAALAQRALAVLALGLSCLLGGECM
jgi:hypothetical protein